MDEFRGIASCIGSSSASYPSITNFTIVDVVAAQRLKHLDVNYLQQDFLANMLDLLNAGLLGNELAEPDDPILPKYKPNKAFGLYYYYEDDRLTLYKETPFNFASVTVSKYDAATLNLKQDGTMITQNVNRSGGTNITIRQGR